MSYQYSNHEYTEMVRLLAKSRDNVARACHEFARLFPNLPTPSRSLMVEVTRNLRDFGQFHAKSEEVSEERESVEVIKNPQEREVNRIYMTGQVRVPNGIGVPLGYLSNVIFSLSCYHILDLQSLHLYLYGQLVADRFILQNIKRFRGQEWDIHNHRHRIKLQEASRLETSELRLLCDMLDLNTEGGRKKQEVRLVEFLLKPESNSPHFRYVRTIEGVVKTYNRAISEEEDYSDLETRVLASGRTKDGPDYSYVTYYNGTIDSDSSRDPCDIIPDNEDREAEAKVIPDKNLSAPIIVEPDDGEMLVQSTRDETASVVSGEGSVYDEEISGEESGEEFDKPADKKAKCLPTDDEIRKYLKQILKGANLEQITMKSVYKAVYNHFPEYDLAYKKDFIKATVKSLL